MEEIIEKGKIYKLEAKSISNSGAYFIYENSEEKILVPKEEIEQELVIGEKYNVFVYGDKDGRIVGSLKIPKITKGKAVNLKVVGTSKVGVYLDWGLEQDLFLLDRNMTKSASEGEFCYVMLIEDRYGRSCATMRVGNYLKEEKGIFHNQDMVKGVVYDFKEHIGAFVAVEGSYNGLVPKNHLYGEFEIGKEYEFRVIHIKEDGKIDLTIRENIVMERDKDADNIYSFIKKSGGYTRLNDESSPEEIKELLGISKKAFKRAVGKLMKEGKVEQNNKGMRILK